MFRPIVRLRVEGSVSAVNVCGGAAASAVANVGNTAMTLYRANPSSSEGSSSAHRHRSAFDPTIDRLLAQLVPGATAGQTTAFRIPPAGKQ